MRLEFSWQIFEKSSNIKFHKNLSSESPVVPCGRTDGHDESNSPLLAVLRKRLKSKILKCNANINFNKQFANECLICIYVKMSTVSFEHLQSISTERRLIWALLPPSSVWKQLLPRRYRQYIPTKRPYPQQCYEILQSTIQVSAA
jgi:hypothetical protein